MYVSNPRKSNFDDLPFYGGQWIITRRQIDSKNNNVVDSLYNGMIVDVYTNLI